MTTLRDKGRELISIAEGEIERRESTIVTLHHKIEQLRKELAEARRQQLAARPPKCETCAYRVIALKTLEEKEKAEK